MCSVVDVAGFVSSTFANWVLPLTCVAPSGGSHEPIDKTWTRSSSLIAVDQNRVFWGKREQTPMHVMKLYSVSPNSPVVRYKVWYFNIQISKKQKVIFSIMKKFLILDTVLMVMKPKCICFVRCETLTVVTINRWYHVVWEVPTFWIKLLPPSSETNSQLIHSSSACLPSLYQLPSIPMWILHVHRCVQLNPFHAHHSSVLVSSSHIRFGFQSGLIHVCRISD